VPKQREKGSAQPDFLGRGSSQSRVYFSAACLLIEIKLLKQHRDGNPATEVAAAHGIPTRGLAGFCKGQAILIVLRSLLLISAAPFLLGRWWASRCILICANDAIFRRTQIFGLSRFQFLRHPYAWYGFFRYVAVFQKCRWVNFCKASAELSFKDLPGTWTPPTRRHFTLFLQSWRILLMLCFGVDYSAP